MALIMVAYNVSSIMKRIIIHGCSIALAQLKETNDQMIYFRDQVQQRHDFFNPDDHFSYGDDDTWTAFLARVPQESLIASGSDFE